MQEACCGRGAVFFSGTLLTYATIGVALLALILVYERRGGLLIISQNRQNAVLVSTE